MGQTNVYSNTRPVFVAPLLQSPINYGFNTKIDAAESGELGHQDVAGATVPIFFGVNSPKPARWKKDAAGYSVSSFGDANTQIDTTKWKKYKKGFYRRAAATAKVKYVSVAINGSTDYAWGMPLSLYTAIGNDRAGLGITDLAATATALKKCIWGANKSSQPPKASKKDGTSGNIYTTFYDASKTALPTGWSPAGGREYEL